MSETLNRIRYRLSMDALVGFLNGPRAFSFQVGKTIVTAVSCHPPGGIPRFAQGTVLEPNIAGWLARMKERDDRRYWPIRSLDCCVSLCGRSNSHSIESPSAMTPRILHQSSSQANSDVYIRARPVVRSEARFPPPHQEPGTGARSCPRGPGFLVARAIELAQAYVLDVGRPHREPNHSANRSASTWSGAG
jgi:hypothetical protein